MVDDDHAHDVDGDQHGAHSALLDLGGHDDIHPLDDQSEPHDAQDGDGIPHDVQDDDGIPHDVQDDDDCPHDIHDYLFDDDSPYDAHADYHDALQDDMMAYDLGLLPYEDQNVGTEIWLVSSCHQAQSFRHYHWEHP